MLGIGPGKGEECDELGAVFAALPEGELVELDFCRKVYFHCQVGYSAMIVRLTERPNLEGVCGCGCGCG